MKGWTVLALTALLVPAGAGVVQAQQPAPSEPTITMERARTIALGRVPNNEGVKSAKLKTKDGVQVWEFDIETAGPGHQEVRVDARTGAIVSNTHEDDLVGTAVSKTTEAAHDVGHAASNAANDVANTADRVLSGDELKNAHPRISEARARQIAMRRFPSAKKVKDVDLERENGVLVWEVDVDTPGEGHQEVTIDANTGRILRTHKEVGIAGKTKQAVEKVTH